MKFSTSKFAKDGSLWAGYLFESECEKDFMQDISYCHINDVPEVIFRGEVYNFYCDAKKDLKEVRRFFIGERTDYFMDGKPFLPDAFVDMIERNDWCCVAILSHYSNDDSIFNRMDDTIRIGIFYSPYARFYLRGIDALGTTFHLPSSFIEIFTDDYFISYNSRSDFGSEDGNKCSFSSETAEDEIKLVVKYNDPQGLEMLYAALMRQEKLQSLASH